MSTWDTTNTSPGSSASNQIHLPLESTGTYNFTVDWGDGNTDLITVWNQPETTHTYAIPGVYNLSIIGTIQGFNFYYGQDELKLLSISTFETLQLGNSGRYFFGCTNLDLSLVTDVLDLTGTITCNAMFYQCTSLTTIGNVSSWDVSNINDMSYMFGESTFNDNINSWDVSNVINMSDMFNTNTVFNQSLNSWNVSGVTDMSSMFYGTSSFNGNITSWDTSSVTTMSGMFNNSTIFNQNISGWDVSSVIDMGNMFAGTTLFNQPIGSWDVSSVQNMTAMFGFATSFNQPLNGWGTNTTNL
jgi:surface protein